MSNKTLNQHRMQGICRCACLTHNTNICTICWARAHGFGSASGVFVLHFPWEEATMAAKSPGQLPIICSWSLGKSRNWLHKAVHCVSVTDDSDISPRLPILADDSCSSVLRWNYTRFSLDAKHSTAYVRAVERWQRRHNIDTYHGLDSLAHACLNLGANVATGCFTFGL